MRVMIMNDIRERFLNEGVLIRHENEGASTNDRIFFGCERKPFCYLLSARHVDISHNVFPTKPQYHAR